MQSSKSDSGGHEPGKSKALHSSKDINKSADGFVTLSFFISFFHFISFFFGTRLTPAPAGPAAEAGTSAEECELHQDCACAGGIAPAASAIAASPCNKDIILTSLMMLHYPRLTLTPAPAGPAEEAGTIAEECACAGGIAPAASAIAAASASDRPAV